MSVTIPEDIVQSVGESEAEARLELAIIFYKNFNVSSGKAARFAGLSRIAFWAELSKRDITLNLDENDVENDVNTLEKLGV